MREELLGTVTGMASSGLRTLCLAYTDFAEVALVAVLGGVCLHGTAWLCAALALHALTSMFAPAPTTPPAERPQPPRRLFLQAAPPGGEPDHDLHRGHQGGAVGLVGGSLGVVGSGDSGLDVRACGRAGSCGSCTAPG